MLSARTFLCLCLVSVLSLLLVAGSPRRSAASPASFVSAGSGASVMLDFEAGPSGSPIGDHYFDEGVMFDGASAFEFAEEAGHPLGFSGQPSGQCVALMAQTTGTVNFGFRASSIDFYHASLDDLTVDVYPLPDGTGTLLASINVTASGSYQTFSPATLSFPALAQSMVVTRDASNPALLDDLHLEIEDGFPIEQVPVFNSTMWNMFDFAILGFGTGCGETSQVGSETSSDLGTGDGVLLHSGQEVRDALDLFIAGRDSSVDLRIMRRHTTRRNQDGSMFGPAWAFNYRHTLVEQPDGELLLSGFSREDIFTVDGSNRWVGTAGRLGVLTWNGASTITVRRSHGLKMIFHVEGGVGALVGHLVEIRSPNQNSILFTYEDAMTEPDLLTRRLLTITESYGRDLNLFYDDLVNPECVTRIEDFSGRTVVYTYDADGDLVTARSPTVTSTGFNDFSSGKTKRYTYRKHPTDPRLAHALTSVIFPNQEAGAGEPRLQWTYEEDTASPLFGFVETHTVGNPSAPGGLAAGGMFSYTYQLLAITGPPDGTTPVIETTVTDRRGIVTEVKCNQLGQMLEERVVTQGIRPGEPASYLRTFEYDDDGLMTKRTDPLGGMIDVTYPDPMVEPRLAASNQQVTLFTADSRGADQDTIKYQTIFEPVFNRPFKVIDPRGFEPGNDPADYTTTYLLDYMEDLPAASAAFAAEMGLTVPELDALFAAAGVTDVGDENLDGLTSQMCGTVIKIIHPTATLPAQAMSVGLPLSQDAEEIFTYNNFGQLLTSTDAEQNVDGRVYNGADDPDGDGVVDVPGATSATGGYLKTFVEDVASAAGRNSGHNPTPVMRSTTYSYSAHPVGPANKRGIPTQITDPRGIVHRQLVNELDQIVLVIRAASVPGSPPGLTAHAYEELTLYDANDNVVERRVQNKDTLDPLVDDYVITQWAYDILDRVRSETLDAGGLDIETTYAYDPSTNLVARVRGVGTTDASEDAWTYDERNILHRRHRGVGSPDTATFQTGIDDNGNFTELIDDSGDTANVAYDGYDRPWSFVDREGNRHTRSYDSSSNVAKFKAHENLSGVLLLPNQRLTETDCHFDERGRLWRTDRYLFHYPGKEVGSLDDGALDPGDGLVSSLDILDRKGRRVALVDADGDLQERRYDGLDRLTLTIDPLGNEVEVAYDLGDNPVVLTEHDRSPHLTVPEVYVSTFAFDALGRLQAATEPNGQRTEYEYDSRDNLIRRRDELGNEVEFVFDRLSRPVQERRFLSATGAGASVGNVDASQGGGDGVVTLLQSWCPAQENSFRFALSVQGV